MPVRNVYRYAYAITSCARAIDHNPDNWNDLLAGTGILSKQLQDPYLRIDRVQEQTFFRNVMRHYPAPATSLRLGQALGLQNIGALGYMLSSSETIAQAIALGRSHRNLLLPGVKWKTSQKGAQVIHTFSSPDEPEDLRDFLCEIAMAAIATHGDQMLGKGHSPDKTHFKCSLPPDRAEYLNIFGDNLVFGAGTYILSYPATWLSKEPAGRDYLTAQSMINLCKLLSAQLYNENNFVVAIRAILRTRQGKMPTLGEIAELLLVSSRTLQRSLRNRHYSFRRLLYEERRARALALLASREVSMESVSEACGFENLRSFYEAFQRWTGWSPVAWQNANHRVATKLQT